MKKLPILLITVLTFGLVACSSGAPSVEESDITGDNDLCAPEDGNATGDGDLCLPEDFTMTEGIDASELDAYAEEEKNNISGDHDLGAPEDLNMADGFDTSDLDPYQ